MANTESTHSSDNSHPTHTPADPGQQPRRGVGQDKPHPARERAPSQQPAPPANPVRAHRMNINPSRSQNRPIPKRKTVHLTLWVKPRVKAELQRIAEQEGVSVSAAGAAFLEQAIRQDIHTQHGALLDTIIDHAIGKHMRSYSTRIAILLVRSLFASEQTRSLATNILGRQPGVNQSVLEDILNRSSSAAKRNITHITPQLTNLIEHVEQWLTEEEGTYE